MEIKRNIKNIFANKPNKKASEKSFILVHYHHDQNYPYIENKITYSEKYKIPYGMTYEDFFKVLSYYSDWIDDNFSSHECSLEGVKYLEQLLPYLNVNKINNNSSETFEVYFEDGPYKTVHLAYYEWYSKNISLKDLYKIYQKYGIIFNDISIDFEKNIKPKRKSLVRIK